MKKIIVIASILYSFLCPEDLFAQTPGILGRLEHITVSSKNGEKREIVAKIDTGADNTSIDSSLVKELGLEDAQTTHVIVDENGRSTRDTVEFQFEIEGKVINTVANVADRSNQSTKVLIGYPDIKGFVVDPNKEFIASPGGFKNYANLMIIPILSAIVVALRYFVGIKTFGVFAPIVIAYTLKDNIHMGLLFISVLTLCGFCLIHFGIGYFKLPKIVEQSILMFLLSSLSLILIPFWGLESFIFFPFIIMAHLIERANQLYEESSYKSLTLYIIWTIILGTFLSLIWRQLAEVDLLILLGMFISAFVLTWVSGKYSGLRVSELLRFKKIVFN